MTYAEQYAQAKESHGVKEISYMAKKLKEGDSVLGRYITRELIASKKDNMPDFYRYDFDTDEGVQGYLFAGSFDKTTGEMMEENHIYCVTFVGQRKLDKNRTVNVFEVEEILDSLPTKSGERE